MRFSEKSPFSQSMESTILAAKNKELKTPVLKKKDGRKHSGEKSKKDANTSKGIQKKVVKKALISANPAIRS